MARPETALSPFMILGCLLLYYSNTKKFITNVSGLGKKLEPIVGCPMLPGSDKPLVIFPGAQVLVEKSPLPNQIYTGPFYPLAVQLKSSGEDLPRRRSSFNLSLDEDPGLLNFILARANTPIIYIALGTLATPSKELVERLVDGLDGGPWAVIWALPEEHQDRLPRKLSEDQWYIGKFLPQYAIFQKKVPKCFISHCGGSSTVEAIAHGIPMLCIPFFGDQFEWAASISSHIKAGIQIDKFKASSNDIRRSLDKILGDKTFEENAKAAQDKMTANAQMRLDFLGAKLEGKLIRVGVPVAAAALEKLMANEDPREVLPPDLRGKPAPKSSCCPCVGLSP